jgi:hypothetical protein
LIETAARPFLSGSPAPDPVFEVEHLEWGAEPEPQLVGCRAIDSALAQFSATRSELLLSQATADYAVVRKLVTDVFAEGIAMTVRETVGAISSLKKNEVSLGELAAKLALDKSVTSRRLRDATDRGYLVNLEIRRGRPARIVLGDPMPEVVKLLPEPTELGA